MALNLATCTHEERNSYISTLYHYCRQPQFREFEPIKEVLDVVHQQNDQLNFVQFCLAAGEQ